MSFHIETTQRVIQDAAILTVNGRMARAARWSAGCGICSPSQAVCLTRVNRDASRHGTPGTIGNNGLRMIGTGKNQSRTAMNVAARGNRNLAQSVAGAHQFDGRF
jgi:hypothetical protein